MKKIISLISVFTLFFFVSVTKVSAKILTNTNGSANVAKNEIVNDDLFVAAQNTTIDGTVNGDVFVGGQTVVISGIINGNLHVAAGTVTISRGWIKSNAYIASGNVTITGSIVDGSILVGAGNVNIDQGTSIAGSVIAGTGNLTLDSQIGRSLYLGTGNATIGSSTKIGKDLYYAISENGQNINFAKGAMISGTTYKTTYKTPTAPTMAIPQTTIITFAFLSFFGALIVGFLYFKLCKNHFSESAEMVTKSFWKSLGIGFLIAIGIVPALIIVSITIIGIPLAGISLLIFLLGLYFAKLIVGFALGKWIVEKLKWDNLSSYWIFTIGLLVVYILKFIPFLGIFVWMVVIWTGLGALFLQTISKYKK